MVLQPKSVIVFDDSPTVRFLLKKLFSELDYSISAVAQDNKSIDSLLNRLIETNSSPEIFTVDLVMPNVNSKYLIKKLKKFHPDSKIAVITGFEDHDAHVEFERTDADFFFVKPIQLEHLQKICSASKQDDFDITH